MAISLRKPVGLICGIVYAIAFCTIWILAFIIDIIRRCLWFCRISDIEHKHVLITGAESGFGLQVSLALAKMGMTVYAGCLRPNIFQEACKTIEDREDGLRKRLFCIKMDTTRDDDVSAASAEVASRLATTGLWAIIHNAGIMGPLGQDEWHSMEDYQKAIEVNFLGHVRVTQAFRSLLSQKEGGRIVFTNSYTTLCMAPFCGSYSASKSAQRAYFRTLCCENALTKIKAISITPGYFKTPLFHNMTEQYWDGWRNIKDKDKSIYSYEMANRRMGFLSKFVDFAAKFNDIDDVVEAFVNAVTSRWPVEDTYVGWDSVSATMVSSAPYSASLFLVTLGRLFLGDHL